MRCNQCEKECNNEKCHKCKVCEFPLLCLCKRTDKLFTDAKIKVHNRVYHATSSTTPKSAKADF
jgi:predicted metal-binding protein